MAKKLRFGITGHMMVKNEEVFVARAIQAALPFCDEFIIFDTGSTDSTVAQIKSVSSKKIRFFEKGSGDLKRLVRLRNEMIEMTKTEWFFLVDGDDIFWFSDIKKIREKIRRLPDSVSRLEILFRDFLKDPHLAASDRAMGRIWRTSAIEFVGDFPLEVSSLKSNPSASLASFSSQAVLQDIINFHMGYFVRSSKDTDVTAVRRWHNIPFPVKPFFGTYPKNLGLTPNWWFFLCGLVWFNCQGLWQKITRKKGSPYKPQ